MSLKADRAGLRGLVFDVGEQVLVVWCVVVRKGHAGGAYRGR